MKDHSVRENEKTSERYQILFVIQLKVQKKSECYRKRGLQEQRPRVNQRNSEKNRETAGERIVEPILYKFERK